VTRADAGIQSLSNLIGKTFAFDEAPSWIAVSTKAHLLEAGIFRSDFMGITNVWIGKNPPEPGLRPHFRQGFRVTAAAILKGEVDAGLTSLRQYEVDKRFGLKLLMVLQSMPRMFVARPDLDSEIVEAFRKALPVAHELADGRKIADNLEWDAIFPGAVLVDDSYFNDLREAMRKAARFDGLPDPFSPDANLP
jgi:ABC-type phosphate/phosphonate transport system substrate-binding protein